LLLTVYCCKQIDSHVKRLDEDLISFAEDLKQEGKIPQDEPAILLSATRDDKRKAHFFTPLGKRIDSRLDRERSLEKDRDCERERDRDSELMPPPGSHRKKSLPPPTDIDQPIDPDEPTYCICGQVTPAQ
jgi:inhibitor of growth protein 4